MHLPIYEASKKVEIEERRKAREVERSKLKRDALEVERARLNLELDKIDFEREELQMRKEELKKKKQGEEERNRLEEKKKEMEEKKKEKMLTLQKLKMLEEAEDSSNLLCDTDSEDVECKFKFIEIFVNL